MNKNLMLCENKDFLKKHIMAKNDHIFLRIPNSKTVLGKKDLTSPNEKYSANEFWSMYNYLSLLIFTHASWATRIVTLSKYHILYELGCSKSRLNNLSLTNQMRNYLDLACYILKYMEKENIISYLPSNLEEAKLSEPFQFVVKNDYMHTELQNNHPFVVVYLFEYYSIFSNNNYPAKTRLELLNLYLCIKTYGKQSKEHCNVCYKSKRSLSNLTGISSRVVDNRYKALVDLHLIKSYLMNTDIDMNILLTISSNTKMSYVEAEVNKYIGSYLGKHGKQTISLKRNGSTCKIKDDLERTYDGTETISSPKTIKHVNNVSKFITPEEEEQDRAYAAEMMGEQNFNPMGFEYNFDSIDDLLA